MSSSADEPIKAEAETGPEGISSQECQPEEAKTDEVTASDKKAASASSGSASAPGAAESSESKAESTPSLPPLTPREFKIYNRLSEQMDYFVSPAGPVFFSAVPIAG